MTEEERNRLQAKRDYEYQKKAEEIVKMFQDDEGVGGRSQDPFKALYIEMSTLEGYERIFECLNQYASDYAEKLEKRLSKMDTVIKTIDDEVVAIQLQNVLEMKRREKEYNEAIEENVCFARK